jgi:hypothetical protein
MANLYGPRIVTDGMVFNVDAGNRKSYPGSGNTLYDLSGNGNNGTLTNGPVLAILTMARLLLMVQTIIFLFPIVQF